MANEKKQPKPTRFTLAPVYLAAGLGVCFLVLTRMVPAMNTVVDEKVRVQQPQPGEWNRLVVGLSAWVCAHQTVCIAAFVVIACAGFVLPFVVRPARYLVWLAALGVFLLDVALAGAGYWTMLTGLLKEVNKIN